MTRDGFVHRSNDLVEHVCFVQELHGCVGFNISVFLLLSRKGPAFFVLL